MQFEESRGLLKLGEVVGFLTAYLVFTTVLYLILNWKHDMQYIVVMMLTLSVYCVGVILHEVLK